MATMSDLAMRILISAKDETAPGVKSARDGVRSISDQLQQLETFAKRILDVRLFGGWALDAVKTADAYKTLQARLQLVSDNTQEYNAAQSELFAIAQRSRSSLESTYTLYGKVETVVKQLGGTQEKAIATTETLNQAIALTSQGAAQDAAAVLQFSQALGSGVLRGDEFNSVMENSQGLAQALADGLDVPITKLRGMAEAGQLTADRLVNALGNSAPKIAEQFAKLPVTVSGAMTQVDNAMTVYIGQSNAANAGTAALSNVIQGLATHFNTVADTALLLGGSYLIKVASGALQSAQALSVSAQAAREKALADAQAQRAALALLQTESQLAAIRVKAAAARVSEMSWIATINAGTDKEIASKKALAVAIKQLHAVQAQASAANLKVAESMVGAEKKTGLLTNVLGVLNTALNKLMLIPFAAAIAEWGLKFDWFYAASMRVKEALVIVTTGIKAMLDGMSASDRWAQIKQIHTEFNQLIEKNSNAAKQAAVDTAQAEQDKSKAIEQATLAQQASFAKVQEATKALTAQIDADAKTQTASIQQALAERLAAIDASNTADAVKDSQRVQAKLQAAQQELQLQQATAQAKLTLIDQEYQKELAQAAGNAQRLNEVETSKRQAKLSVYQGLAEFYTGEVSRLTEIYNQETVNFNQAKQAQAQGAFDHQQHLLDIERTGMTERQRLQSEQLQFDQSLAELKKELAKGEGADKDQVNRLLNTTIELQGKISQAELAGAKTSGERTVAIAKAKERENQIWAAQSKVLDDNAKAYEDSQGRAAQAVTKAKEELDKAGGVINDITTKLAQQYFLNIGIDQASLSSAQAAIADLVKPETKTITIETVNAGSAVPAQATGGLAGQPTGQPWRFSSGGWARMAGLLSGYGGGDRRKALLEDGEFVVRKEAVQKLGVPFLQAVNQGEAPILRAFGGSVGADIEKAFQQEGLKKIVELLKKRKFDSALENSTNSWSAKKSLSEQVASIADEYSLDNSVLGQVKAAIENLPQTFKLHTMLGFSNDYKDIGKSKLVNSSWATNDFLNAPLLQESKKQGLVFDTLVNAIGKGGNNMPSFKLPALNLPTMPSVPAQTAVPAKVINVQFKAPDGGKPISANFGSESDVNKFLDVLKTSGMSVGAV